MSDAATLCEAPTPDAPTDWARDVVERRLRILDRVAEAGVEIIVALEAQAKGGAVVVQGDVAMAYARAARAVRQTIMLQAHLIEALRDQGKASAERKAAAARIVREVIEDDERGGEAEGSERLRAEAAERLEREDFSALFARPFGEVVTEIVRDLGLSPDWLKLAQDCAAAEAGLSGGSSAAPDDPDDGEGVDDWTHPYTEIQNRLWRERTGKGDP
jgi:hypothetical protein